MRRLAQPATLVMLGFTFIGLCPAPALAADDNLNIVFTTTSAGGQYGNRHVHVVWLTNESGQWVCTVGNDAVNKRAVWANARASSLATWYKANPKPKDDVDARTGATPTAYTTYSINWNWRKLDGSLVPDGTYKLQFECTNAEGGTVHNYAVFTIVKGRAGWSVGPVSQGGYLNVKLTSTVAALSLENAAASDVTESSATLGGTLGGANNKAFHTYIYWGDNDGGTDPRVWDYRVDMGSMQDRAFSTKLTLLTRGKTYFYRCYAANESASIWASSTRQFTAGVSPSVIRKGDVWRYFEGTTAASRAWNGIVYTPDATWKAGPTGIGFGDGDDATILQMQNLYTTVYMRDEFSLAWPGSATGMQFTVDYDDGFVAYLNGQEVARRGVPQGQDKDTTATDHPASIEGGQIEQIDLTPFLGLLRTGTNVFAIEAHNSSVSDSDLTMIPELTIQGLRSPQPDLTPSARELHFDSIATGTAGDLTVNLTNAGVLPLTVNSLKIVGLMPEAFVLHPPQSLPFDIPAGTYTPLRISFSPTAAQVYAYTYLMIGSNDWDEPLISISLSGVAQKP
jgi:hypothetical protein